MSTNEEEKNIIFNRRNKNKIVSENRALILKNEKSTNK